jgi:hypothetical protein
MFGGEGKMKRKLLPLTIALLTIGLNLIIPACGSHNSTNSPYYNQACAFGTSCTGVNGTPIFPYPFTTAIDATGSMAQIMIYAQGSSYSNVTVQAQVIISPYNTWGCPPGQYMVQGTGAFQPNYGGTLGYIQAAMTGSSGFQVQLGGEVYAGPPNDPFTGQQYYYMGSFANSCDPSAVGE